uniref:ULP_PROTEASE domain-containing protein n=1 Tax=Heterorhabditis bacteriophora TaxID=37862 RepID=A0A1I7WYS9_HETBA
MQASSVIQAHRQIISIDANRCGLAVISVFLQNA